MTRAEYQKWVDYAVQNQTYAHIPARLIDNYADWHHRSFLGRYLLRAGQPLIAIKVLRSVINRDVPLNSKNGDVMSDTENIIWCLQDLAAAVFRCEHAPEVALEYLEKAISLANRYNPELEFVVRGELWRDRWEILRHSGLVTEAQAEAISKLATQPRAKGKSNSILFNALDFLAELASEKGKIKAALWLMREALRYFPNDYKKGSKIKDVWYSYQVDPYSALNSLRDLTHQDYLVWDDACDDWRGFNGVEK